MRVNKELLCALAQHKMKTLTRKYQKVNFELKNLFIGLTTRPRFRKKDVIIKNEAFNVLFSQIMDDTVGTEAKKTTCFIKNFFITSDPWFSSTREQLWTIFASRAWNGQILFCFW